MKHTNLVITYINTREPQGDLYTIYHWAATSWLQGGFEAATQQPLVTRA